MAGEAACYIGTSGWSYPKGEGTWKGHFYPPGTGDELAFYSRSFDTVEVNSSFYRPPAPKTVQSWADRTPADFRFSVKLWQKFTHPAMYAEATGEAAAVSQRDVDLFRAALEPLARDGKLGVLLAQFPPSFKNADRSRSVIAGIANAFSGYPVAVELRHRSWSDDPSTAPLLREHRLAWVSIDEPRFASSIAEDVPITADFAYFRFHGRNAKDWWTGDAETRYKYHYDASEISGLAGRLRAAMREAARVFVFFNNHYQAYAVRNVTDLKRALGLPVRDVQMPLGMPEETGGAARAR
jgi:uncharacterized protein YecE (DUF72 family)